MTYSAARDPPNSTNRKLSTTFLSLGAFLSLSEKTTECLTISQDKKKIQSIISESIAEF